MISSLLPDTARKIFYQLGIEGFEELTNWESTDTFGLIADGTKVHRGEVLFPRLDVEEEIKVLLAIIFCKSPRHSLIYILVCSSYKSPN